jgi:DNA topoisomerase-1
MTEASAPTADPNALAHTLSEVEDSDPATLAAAVDLTYVTDSEPGYHRRRHGRGFTYKDAAGKTVRHDKLRQRFDALVIPPAWTEVWICADANGHLQATGRDEAGRKQYIYHERWATVRDFIKYERLRIFAEALPTLREQVAADLRKRHLSHDKVAALVVRLLEETLIRVGNSQYAQQNESYGLTTLHDEHVAINGSEVTFEFRGKSGKEHEVALHDKRLARLVKACQDLPGQHLFQYLDESGAVCALESGDINAYLRNATCCNFTAKDFRTWGGTVWTAHLLHAAGPANSKKAREGAIKEAIKGAAAQLGNTPTVCRTHYIHPAILESYRTERLFAEYETVGAHHQQEKYGLTADEAVVLTILREETALLA